MYCPISKYKNIAQTFYEIYLDFYCFKTLSHTKHIYEILLKLLAKFKIRAKVKMREYFQMPSLKNTSK